MTVRHVALTGEPLDPGALSAILHRDHTGAVVAFTGITRSPDEDGDDVELDYEAWPERALAEMRAIADDAAARWSLTGVVAVHRIGRVGPAEPAVVVAAAAAHRAEAFAAAAFLIDRIKAQAPIWKLERTVARADWR